MIGVELDPTGAAVAQALYTSARIRTQSVADTDVAGQDLVIGVVNFGAVTVPDYRHNPHRHTSGRSPPCSKRQASRRPESWLSAQASVRSIPTSVVWRSLRDSKSAVSSSVQVPKPGGEMGKVIKDQSRIGHAEFLLSNNGFPTTIDRPRDATHRRYVRFLGDSGGVPRAL
jgi:hypothetical protein